MMKTEACKVCACHGVCCDVCNGPPMSGPLQEFKPSTDAEYLLTRVREELCSVQNVLELTVAALEQHRGRLERMEARLMLLESRDE